MKKYPFQKGQFLVELILSIAIASILLPALLTGLFSSRAGKAQQDQRVLAVSMLKETVEAVRSVREKDWNSFAVNGTFHPLISGSSWTLATGSAVINGFTQSVLISDVNRDPTGTIATSGGTFDPSTKKVDITISWTLPYPSSIGNTLYFARLNNISYTETTQTDFNKGTTNNVKVQATSGSSLPDDGEIVLSQTGGFGDWCQPALTFTDTDLPKNGVANAVSAIQGQAAAGTGDNSSGVSYANITISDPPYPQAPVATVSGTFDGYKTNGVFTEANYAYLATDTNGKQGVIIDLTSYNPGTGKYSEAGSLNLQSSSTNGKSIYVLNNIAYLTGTNGKLYTFNIASRSGSHTPIGNVALEGVGNKVVVVGTNAYIAVNATSNQLQIVNVADPTHPTIPAGNTISVAGLAGRDIFVNVPQNRAYLVTAVSTSTGVAEFFLINLATKTVLGSYDTHSHGDMDPKGVVAVSGARAVIVGTGGQQYQVLSLSNESAPTWCGGLNIASGVNGIATVFTAAQRAYSYIITGDSNAEFKIIEGGPGAGNGNYVPTGTFISQAFGPASLSTAFNNFIATIHQPVSKDVQLQVAVADAVGNPLNCTSANYTFIGTDGNGTGPNDYFSTNPTGLTTISGTIPYGNYSPNYKNPDKCFKYKLILSTTDSTLTPVFNDITVNYSP